MDIPVTVIATKAKTLACSSTPWPILTSGLNGDTYDANASTSNTTKFQQRAISQHELARIFFNNCKIKLSQAMLI
jgi:hypothetical protein